MLEGRLQRGEVKSVKRVLPPRTHHRPYKCRSDEQRCGGPSRVKHVRPYDGRFERMNTIGVPHWGV